MADFLSPAWFEALAHALAAAPADASDERVRIAQVVTGAPDGEVRYSIELGGGAPGSLEVGTTERAVVTLVEDYATARAIAQGAPVSAALGEGRIKVRGDANALVAAYGILAAVSPGLPNEPGA